MLFYFYFYLKCFFIWFKNSINKNICIMHEHYLVNLKAKSYSIALTASVSVCTSFMLCCMLPVFLLQEVTWLAESRRAGGGGAPCGRHFRQGRQTDRVAAVNCLPKDVNTRTAISVPFACPFVQGDVMRKCRWTTLGWTNNVSQP